jgi:hypothetical protein
MLVLPFCVLTNSPSSNSTCLNFITLPDSGSDEEVAVAHNFFFAGFRLGPDVEAQTNNIDVGAGAPGRPVCSPQELPNAMWMPGNFSPSRILPMTRSMRSLGSAGIPESAPTLTGAGSLPNLTSEIKASIASASSDFL